MGFPIGTQRITADSALVANGRPVRIFNVNLVSGGTASTLTLRNGTSASANAFDQVDGAASLSVTKNWAGGLFFPDGCFLDVDANISYATVSYESQL
jgi:hypothetical protein